MRFFAGASLSLRWLRMTEPQPVILSRQAKDLIVGSIILFLDEAWYVITIKFKPDITGDRVKKQAFLGRGAGGTRSLGSKEWVPPEYERIFV